MRKLHLLIGLGLGIAIVILAILVCLTLTSLVSKQQEERVSSNEGTYSFNSQTILQSLAQGNMNVFALQMATPSPSPTNLSGIQWRQTDYISLANAFNQFTQKGTLDAWSMKRLSSGLDCKYAPLGPQDMTFNLFKTVHVSQGDSRLERNLYLQPQQNLISWDEEEYHPYLEGQLSFDLVQIKIPAEKALQIAEMEGGKKARLTVNNICQIVLSITAGSENDNWRISYLGYHGDSLFEIAIDKQTGEYKIIYSK